MNRTPADVSFDAPLSSSAVTVIVASPRDTPVTVSVFPSTDTVATSSSLDSAVTSCLSPLSPSVTSTVTVRVPGGARGTVTSEIEATTGRLFGTVALNRTPADVSFDASLSSSAVTVIVASPRDTPVTVSVLPSTDTVATLLSLEIAVTSCVSPLSLSVTSTVTVRVPGGARGTVTSEIEATTGRLFGTVALNRTPADVSFDASLSSSAVTVIVASPRDTPVTVSVLPSTDTVATLLSLEIAVTSCVSPLSPSVTSTVTVAVPGGSRGTVTSEIGPTTGWLFGTVTSNSADPDAPQRSVAVTVTVAVPRDTPRTVTVLPDTDTVATSSSLDSALTVCVSPLSLSVTLAVRVPVDPRDTVRSEIEPTVGPLFGTVALNVTATEAALSARLLSLAVTDIVAVPHATPVTVTVLPVTLTVATSSSLDSALTSCVSPESPSFTVAVLVAVDPRGTVTSEIESTTGRLFGTVTSNSTSGEVPQLSDAVTVIVAVPRDTPVTVSVLPDTDTVATVTSSELAETVGLSPPDTDTVRATFDPRGTVASEMEPTVGPLPDTATSNSSASDVSFDFELLSFAVTVTVAVPHDTPVTVRVVPFTETVATPVASEVADTVCVSPESPSVTATFRVTVRPFDTVASSIAPTAGRLFGTVTSNSSAAEVALSAPLWSFAVTEIVAVPRDTPVTVSGLPVADTVATPAASELARTVCVVSPASASVTLTATDSVDSRDTVASSMAPTAGRLFGTVTSNSTAAEAALSAALSSVAVTSTVASPRDTPVSVSVLPSTDTVATPLSSELADTACVSSESSSVTVTATVAVAPAATDWSEMAETTGRSFGAANVTVTASDQTLQSVLHARAR